MRALLYMLAAVLLWASCKKSGEIPAYIYVPDMQLVTNPTEQGSASENIADVWVYVNDNVQGVYELPAHVPILAEGPTKFSFFGGIKINGITNTRAAYPAYDDTTLTLTLVPGETDTVVPVVRYLPSTTFLLKEDFENGNEFSNVTRVLNEPVVFEGNACGKVDVDSLREIRILSSGFYPIDNFARTLFVEMDYKSSHIIEAGFVVRGGLGSFEVRKLTISPQADWNKIYINYTPEIGRTLAEEVQLFFIVDATGDNEEIEVFFDNIKLVYF